MNPRKFFRPKFPVLDKQCASCPFNEDNNVEFGAVITRFVSPSGAYASVEEARRLVREDTAQRGDFMCHHTVYAPGSTMPGPAVNYRQCPGALKHFIACGELHAVDSVFASRGSSRKDTP